MRIRRHSDDGSRLGSLRPCLLTVCLWLAVASGSLAQVTFFVDDELGFDAAASALSFAGREDFESSTLPPDMGVVLPDPLAPGVPNPPFPEGTNVATGLTVQSNTLGANPTVPSPGFDLVTASAGFFGTPTDQISNNLGGASFDMIFGLPDTTAVSFVPLIFDPDSSGDPGTASIRVYDTDNTLIGLSEDIPVTGFMNPTSFVGVVAETGVDIGRINIFATSAGDFFSGADDIDVYTEEALLVVLESFTAEVTGDGVRLTWRTTLEVDTVGFRLLRMQLTGNREKAARPVPLHDGLLPAAGTELEGADYEFLDNDVRAPGTYRYLLEDVDLFDRVTRHPPLDVTIRQEGRRVPPARRRER